MRAMSAVSRAASVPAAPMAMPSVAAASAGRVVDAVADHADGAVALAQLADGGDLVGGQEAGADVVDAGRGADRRRRLGVVAGEHDEAFDAGVAQAGERRGRGRDAAGR